MLNEANLRNTGNRQLTNLAATWRVPVYLASRPPIPENIPHTKGDKVTMSVVGDEAW